MYGLKPVPFKLTHDESVGEKVNTDTDQDSSGPAAAIYVFFEEDFACDGVGDEREGCGCRGDQAEIQVVQGEEQRKKGQSQKSDPGEEPWAGDDGSNCALQPGMSADVVEVTDGFHGGGGEHFSCG